MRLAVLVALLLTPLAAGVGFLSPPAPAADATACGDGACVAILPGETSVRIAPGHTYAFLAADGALLAGGTACAPGILDVPGGAVALVLRARAC